MKNIQKLIEYFKLFDPQPFFDIINEFISNKAPLPKKKTENKEKLEKKEEDVNN